MLLGIILKLYKIQGTSIIKAITRGKRIIQQNDINWSNLILGKEALTQTKTNIIAQVFSPRVRPYLKPSEAGLVKNVFLSYRIISIYASKSINCSK